MTEAKIEKIVADMLLPGLTMKEVAQQNGISDRTLRNLRKTEAFKKAIAAARLEAYERVFDVVCKSAPDSARNLIEIMNDDKAPASARVSASRSVLEYALGYYNQKEILERLATVEKLIEGISNDEEYTDQVSGASGASGA